MHCVQYAKLVDEVKGVRERIHHYKAQCGFTASMEKHARRCCDRESKASQIDVKGQAFS